MCSAERYQSSLIFINQKFAVIHKCIQKLVFGSVSLAAYLQLKKYVTKTFSLCNNCAVTRIGRCCLFFLGGECSNAVSVLTMDLFMLMRSRHVPCSSFLI